MASGAAASGGPWWREAVVYQIYPRSWADGDGDGIGDLPGICAQLEWLRVAAACAAHQTPLSAHCSQSLHAHVACVPPNLRHIEYFHDHARIDQIMFDGALAPIDGSLRPADDRPGLGLTPRRADAEPHRVA